MNFTVAAILALGVQGEPAPKVESPFKALCEVAKRLDDGIKLFLAGKDMKESFKTWDAGETSERVVAKMREDLAKNHVTSARMFGLELRLVFFSEGKLVYEVSAFVHVTPTEAALCGIRGRTSMGTGKSSLPLDKCEKDAKPFGDAGAALLKMLKSEKVEKMPWVDPEKVVDLLPEFYRKDVKKGIEKAKAEAEKARGELAALAYDEVRVMLDEQYTTPFGAEGLPKDGMIRGKLRFNEAGEVTYRFSRYERE